MLPHGLQSGAILRSDQPGRHHPSYRIRESGTGNVAGLSGADLFPRQSPYRHHRSDQHSAGDVWGFHSALSDRDAGESAVTGRGRLRHHHRLHHHRDREHLSASHLREHCWRDYLALHTPRFARSRRPDVLLDADFHDRLSAAVHDARSRGRDFFADVAYLRIRADYRDSAGGDAHAGAELFPAAQRDEGNPQHSLGSASSVLPQPLRQDFAMASADADRNPPGDGRRTVVVFTSGRRIPAQAGGGKHLGASDAAAHHFALSCKRPGAGRARGIQIVSRGDRRRLADRPSRRWDRHDRILQHRIFRGSEAAA